MSQFLNLGSVSWLPLEGKTTSYERCSRERNVDRKTKKITKISKKINYVQAQERKTKTDTDILRFR